MKTRVRILFFLCLLAVAGLADAQQQELLRADTELFGVAGSINVEVLKDGKSVRITWEPPRETGEIIIARNPSVIDTPEKCYISDSLGKFPSGIANGVNQIYDYNLRPGTYYYAVVLSHHVRKKDLKLVPNRNFTTIPIVIEQSSSPPTSNSNPEDEKKKVLSDDARVTDIAVKREGKYLRVSWEPYRLGVAGETIYSIYRSAEPLSSLSLMRKAEKLAEVSHPENSFLDQDLNKSQTIYYGVTVKQGLKEVIPLIQNQSFIRQFYVYDQDKRKQPNEDNITKSEYSFEEMHVKDLNSTPVDVGIRLDWKAPENPDENTVYSIYQGTKPLSGGVATFLGGNIRKLGEVNHPETNVMVRMKPSKSTIYFGVTVRRGDKEDFTLSQDQSYVAIEGSANSNTVQDESPKENQPTISKDENKIVASDEELNKILKSTYWKNDYSEAIRQLAPFEQTDNQDVRGKAKFFTGLSYYRNGDYRKALRYFVQKEVKSYNPDRTEFWTKHCLAKISGGRH
ncbi:hypothetical protein LEP1GSC058_3625 [Leptospira fainei serovar Hurstbridge str. BUT 6]|uniref:Tetratricopeptide repeat protein n=1 Tax=Leptospira fainei serovar Hurstbridge str. BUT 6 TaxID=1193011 RepID=S3UV56_9LEPT|nr:hypothetical protein [Leptospira fainei]EPG73128.1 hypothetical protein LEP1GSC058_3625 [Leptospira fainei serovar Hurstbridge str. BUT 6]